MSYWPRKKNGKYYPGHRNVEYYLGQTEKLNIILIKQKKLLKI